MDRSDRSHVVLGISAHLLRLGLFCGVLLIPLWAGNSGAQEAGGDIPRVTVDADYPGGNIVAERIDGDTVHLRPDLRDTEGWWFYWNFGVRGAQGRTLTFQFHGGGPVGVRGPAVSTDDGRTWSWLGSEAATETSFTFTFADDAQEVRFCLGMPYQAEDLRRFLTRHRGNPHLRVEELCRTPHGRLVEKLHVGRLDGTPRFRVLVTARHHACEMMASYALEGLLAAALAETDDGRWIRENVEILAIPFMDKDGVEEGDQGKNRKPRDHNRDYDGTSVHPSVAALRRYVPEWSGGRLYAAFDLHCPYIRGPHNEVIYIVGNADDSLWQQQCRFGLVLEQVQHGPLVYKAADNLPFGAAWNTGANYAQGKSFGGWASEIAGIRLVASFEIPYANVRGRPVTAESARSFGSGLTRAICRYLESSGQ